MRAGLETLRHLKSNAGIYDRISKMGERAREILESNLIVPGRHVRSTGICSLFRTHFCFDAGQRISSARDAYEKADGELQDWFKLAMINQGIYILGGGGAISSSHTGEDLDLLRQACENISN
jgi:glutamate-1-semialdehyde aminotransferase